MLVLLRDVKFKELRRMRFGDQVHEVAESLPPTSRPLHLGDYT